MTSSLRKSGIEPLGEIAWGTHVCHFFETARDVIDTFVPFFAAGMKQGERGVWLVAPPIDERAAAEALRGVPGAEDAVQLIHSRAWFVRHGSFDPEKLFPEWDALIHDALRRGFTGLRISGCQGWQREQDWKPFAAYEESIKRWAAGKPVLVLCSYALADVGAADILDVALRHQKAI